MPVPSASNHPSASSTDPAWAADDSLKKTVEKQVSGPVLIAAMDILQQKRQRAVEQHDYATAEKIHQVGEQHSSGACCSTARWRFILQQKRQRAVE